MDAKTAIQTILATSEKYKKCYFWSNTGNASNRRRQEFDYDYAFSVGADTFEVNQSLSISCSNFYFKTRVLKNGKQTNITPLKTALKRI